MQGREALTFQCVSTVKVGGVVAASGKPGVSYSPARLAPGRPLNEGAFFGGIFKAWSLDSDS